MGLDSERPRLMIIGGFLGAGKTTTILRIAERLQERGATFGIVTNDQGSDLVDTRFLAAHGLVVNEVTGGCFCCNFDQFSRALAEYGEQADVVLAEPVGSCTDLVATLFRPLRATQTDRYDLAPLSVVIDPRRARRYLANQGSPEINYLFEKQAQEADLLVLNKVDTLAPPDVKDLRRELSARFPGRPVCAISARDGTGFDDLMRLAGTIPHDDRDLEISYDRYGESEAALGWLNTRALVTEAAELDPNDAALRILAGIATAARERSWDIAHAKIYLVGGLEFTKASITDTDAVPVLDERMGSRPATIEIVLNARVAAPADALLAECRRVIVELCPSARFQATSAFQPSYPTPTHRIRP